MQRWMLVLGLSAIAALVSGGNVVAQVRYASERSPHRFAGATRVVLDNFDTKAMDAKAASLQLDNNDVIFSTFGEQRVTVVFYKSFQVKLTRLQGADPDGKDRCIFAVELPKDYAAALGKSSLRLVAQVGAKSKSQDVRLLLVNSKGQVTNTLELRSAGNVAKASAFSASDEPSLEHSRQKYSNAGR